MFVSVAPHSGGQVNPALGLSQPSENSSNISTSLDGGLIEIHGI